MRITIRGSVITIYPGFLNFKGANLVIIHISAVPVFSTVLKHFDWYENCIMSPGSLVLQILISGRLYVGSSLKTTFYCVSLQQISTIKTGY